MPGPLGFAPTRNAKSESLKAISGSSVMDILSKEEKAQSSNSIATPFKASNAGDISNRFKLIF